MIWQKFVRNFFLGIALIILPLVLYNYVYIPYKERRERYQLIETLCVYSTLSDSYYLDTSLGRYRHYKTWEECVKANTD